MLMPLVPFYLKEVILYGNQVEEGPLQLIEEIYLSNRYRRCLTNLRQLLLASIA